MDKLRDPGRLSVISSDSKASVISSDGKEDRREAPDTGERRVANKQMAMAKRIVDFIVRGGLLICITFVK